MGKAVLKLPAVAEGRLCKQCPFLCDDSFSLFSSTKSGALTELGVTPEVPHSQALVLRGVATTSRLQGSEEPGCPKRQQLPNRPGKRRGLAAAGLLGEHVAAPRGGRCDFLFCGKPRPGKEAGRFT